MFYSPLLPLSPIKSHPLSPHSHSSRPLYPHSNSHSHSHSSTPDESVAGSAQGGGLGQEGSCPCPPADPASTLPCAWIHWWWQWEGRIHNPSHSHANPTASPSPKRTDPPVASIAGPDLVPPPLPRGSRRFSDPTREDPPVAATEGAYPVPTPPPVRILPPLRPHERGSANGLEWRCWQWRLRATTKTTAAAVMTSGF